jgi:hypothetical protein
VADLARALLRFDHSCRACARREVRLPPVLPAVGDDFDWKVRDFEGFRRFMLEDLAARFPERKRWTAADMEVVLVEAFAAALDQLSDMLDRVAAEATLETARRPDSVLDLLSLVGHDVLGPAMRLGLPPFDGFCSLGEEAQRRQLGEYWLANPDQMDEARRAGPRAIRTQRRMVSLEDYALRVEAHPLVNRAQAALEWNGAWPLVRVAVTLSNDRDLEQDPFAPSAPFSAADAERLRKETEDFHSHHDLPPLAEFPDPPSFRMLLHSYIEAFRMLGQEVKLQPAELVPIELALSIRVKPGYFQSEVRREAERALGRGPDGFFQPGRLRFAEDLHAADIIQALMTIDGVENVCVNRFKRLGLQFADESARGVIRLSGLEIAVCDNDNDPQNADRGYFRLSLHGGRPG